MMNEAAKEARREYARKWRRLNPDKVRKHQENYWMKKARQAEAAEGSGQPQEENKA